MGVIQVIITYANHTNLHYYPMRVDRDLNLIEKLVNLSLSHTLFANHFVNTIHYTL